MRVAETTMRQVTATGRTDGLLRLDLALVLPGVPDAADACVGRLLDELGGLPGVARAHVLPAESDAPPTLCIHHDPRRLDFDRLCRMVLAAGARLTDRYGHLVWTLPDPHTAIANWVGVLRRGGVLVMVEGRWALVGAEHEQGPDGLRDTIPLVRRGRRGDPGRRCAAVGG